MPAIRKTLTDEFLAAAKPEEHPTAARLVASWAFTLMLGLLVAVFVFGLHAMHHPSDCRPPAATKGR